MATSPDPLNESDRAERGKRSWQRVQARLRAELGEDVYSSWFSSAMFETCTDGHVELSVATRFLKHWIEHNFGPRLLELWTIEDEAIERYTIHVRTNGARRIARFGSTAETQTARGNPANTNHSGDGLSASATNAPASKSGQQHGRSVGKANLRPSLSSSTRSVGDAGSGDEAGNEGSIGTPLDPATPSTPLRLARATSLPFAPPANWPAKARCLAARFCSCVAGLALAKPTSARRQPPNCIKPASARFI
jgi:hypothetical protein